MKCIIIFAACVAVTVAIRMEECGEPVGRPGSHNPFEKALLESLGALTLEDPVHPNLDALTLEDPVLPNFTAESGVPALTVICPSVRHEYRTQRGRRVTPTAKVKAMAAHQTQTRKPKVKAGKSNSNGKKRPRFLRRRGEQLVALAQRSIPAGPKKRGRSKIELDVDAQQQAARIKRGRESALQQQRFFDALAAKDAQPQSPNLLRPEEVQTPTGGQRVAGWI